MMMGNGVGCGVFVFFFSCLFFFFFKQKTAYEIYQCDWSSDVCSSDLINIDEFRCRAGGRGDISTVEDMIFH